MKNEIEIITTEKLRKHLPPNRGGEIFCFESIGSTNSYAQELCHGDIPNASVVLAQEQTQGTGRMGRSFYSQYGKGIYLSYILKLSDTKNLNLLTSYAGIAVCNVVERLGIQPKIKWPNDIILENKKVCGILTKLVTDSVENKIKYAIIGIGLNVLHSAEDFPKELSEKSISLKMAGGRGLSCALLAAQIIMELDKILITQNWLTENPALHIKQLKVLSCTLGRDVTVTCGNECYQAKAIDLSNDGGLVISYEDTVKIITSGEVSIAINY